MLNNTLIHFSLMEICCKVWRYIEEWNTFSNQTDCRR